MPPRRAPAGIPVSVPAERSIARREQFTGTVPLRQLRRLVPLLAGDQGELAVELALSRDVAGGWLKGRITGRLELTCQRGLHPFPWECDLDVALRLVNSEAEEEQAMNDSEPCLIEDDRLPLRDIVEDEVMLGLPMMPRCPAADCAERFLK